jgi:hypothetical protein
VLKEVSREGPEKDPKTDDLHTPRGLEPTKKAAPKM